MLIAPRTVIRPRTAGPRASPPNRPPRIERPVIKPALAVGKAEAICAMESANIPEMSSLSIQPMPLAPPTARPGGRLCEGVDPAGQDADDREGDREVREFGHGARKLLCIAHAMQDFHVLMLGVVVVVVGSHLSSLRTGCWTHCCCLWQTAHRMWWAIVEQGSAKLRRKQPLNALLDPSIRFFCFGVGGLASRARGAAVWSGGRAGFGLFRCWHRRGRRRSLSNWAGQAGPQLFTAPARGDRRDTGV